MADWRSPERLRFLRIDHRAIFARKQFARLVGIIALVWVAYVFLVSEHSVFRQAVLARENVRLRDEITKAESALDSLEVAVIELETDRSRIERLARERYHYVGEEEKAYVFVEVDKEDSPRLLEQALARRRELEEKAKEKERAKEKGERH